MEESVMTCGNFGRNKKKISKKNLILQHHQKKTPENENNGVEMTPAENLYSNRDDYYITPEQGAVDSSPVENMYSKFEFQIAMITIWCHNKTIALVTPRTS